MNRRSLAFVLATLLLALAAVKPIHAQHADTVAHGRVRVPLTIALVSTLPHAGAPYEIIRRTTGADRDVLLIQDSAATAENLTDAIRGVITARYAGGDTATTAMVLRVRPQSLMVDLRPVFPWARRVLIDLQNAAARPLEGVGTVRSVRIWLPPQHQRRGVRPPST